MKRLKLLGLALVPLLMTYCHAVVTGPRLWSHNSSAAFDAFVAFYLIDIGLLICMAMHVASEWKSSSRK